MPQTAKWRNLAVILTALTAAQNDIKLLEREALKPPPGAVKEKLRQLIVEDEDMGATRKGPCYGCAVTHRVREFDGHDYCQTCIAQIRRIAARVVISAYAQERQTLTALQGEVARMKGDEAQFRKVAKMVRDALIGMRDAEQRAEKAELERRGARTATDIAERRQVAAEDRAVELKSRAKALRTELAKSTQAEVEATNACRVFEADALKCSRHAEALRGELDAIRSALEEAEAEPLDDDGNGMVEAVKWLDNERNVAWKTAQEFENSATAHRERGEKAYGALAMHWDDGAMPKTLDECAKRALTILRG